MLNTIDDAASSATSYFESLTDASQQLQDTNDGPAMGTIIEQLLEGAKEMEINNKSFWYYGQQRLLKSLLRA